MHRLRWPCPMDSRYLRITSSPAYSPDAPLVGCSEQASKPVQLSRYSSKDSNISRYPAVWLSGAKGCMLATSGQLQGASEETEFNFMVQEPKEIMDLSRAKSFNCSVCMYLIISVSEWMLLKIFCCRKGAVRAKSLGNSPVTTTSAAAVGDDDPRPAAFNADTKAITSSSLWVSSKLADTREASSARRFNSLACNCSTRAAALMGDTSSATVSKKFSVLATAKPKFPASREKSCAKAWTFLAIF